MRPFETTVAMPLAEARQAVEGALAAHGFGVLTEIDVAATLKAKLGIEVPPLVILDVCNPRFAHQAIELDPDAALVLTCNVVLESTAEGGTRVRALNPHDLMPDPAFAGLAQEAAHELAAALDAIGSGV
ncbi:DUF302 domain-containing protein [soil metagenome]